ncbi:MAG: GNAT family N-acetyltransferase [Dysgonamonadaceae bacterium]|jgi:hypothetical protein|nr:GNAT family N-acetyltransferase [Dysgonamonadaceae bacterium]
MEYSIKKIEVDEESLVEIFRFLKDVFPKSNMFSPEHVKWQYAENPSGAMVGFNAWDEGRIVSHFAGLPLEMSLFGKIRKGLLCINVSTNSRYRGKKLFTLLGEKTIQYATENGFEFMIAVPNANSTHAFFKYFGFYLISRLSAKVGFGQNIYPNKDFNCYKCWNENLWAWRLNNPSNSYFYNKRQIITTPIAGFAKTLSKSCLPENLVDLASQSIGFRPLNLYVGLGADTSKGLYFNIPSFIKQPPFNLVFKDLTGEIPVIKKDDIFLQLIDLDTI